jgi:hypothetical protein
MVRCDRRNAAPVYAPDLHSSPVFVNAAGLQGQAGTSGTFALPSSRVNGNVLIVFIHTVAGSQTFSVGGGWTIGDTSTDANTSTALQVISRSLPALSIVWRGRAGTPPVLPSTNME